MIFKSQVLGCGGNSIIQCYLYSVVDSTWNLYPSGVTRYSSVGSIVFKEKFYFFDDKNPVIFNPETLLWSTWPMMPRNQYYSCTVVSKNTLLRFGGDPCYRCIYQYSSVNESWTEISTSSVPMDMYVCFIMRSFTK